MEKLSKEKLSEMLLKMYKIRLFEKTIENLYFQDLVTGPLHLYVGEEAVAVGACSTLKENDYIISTHRGHGHCIAKGANLKKMMAELLGRETGYCKGRGGSMHLADLGIGLLVSSGIVGGGIPMAVGAGFSSYYRDGKLVVLSFFGDGATNQGSFHESLNLASLWKLPVVFICENNLYAITVSVARSLPIKDIADRAVSYGIPGKIVDGMSVLAVYKGVKEAVARAREGKGPSLIECKTYRFKGHWVGDPIVYRTEEEVEKWRKKDPILNFRKSLLKQGVFTEIGLDNIKNQAEEEIEEAVNFAKNSPFPDPNEVTKYVYYS
ncbi:Acetoin:2,6-dichlorophenolindophenol oxidoreductase subunit alpha [subsurface metagenome]